MQTTTTTETRKYRVIAPGTKGVTVALSGSFASEQAWREAARDAAGPDAQCLSATHGEERVIRLFPWWTQ